MPNPSKVTEVRIGAKIRRDDCMKADEGRGMDHVRWGEVGEARWGKTDREEVLLDSERLQHQTGEKFLLW